MINAGVKNYLIRNIGGDGKKEGKGMKYEQPIIGFAGQLGAQ